MCDRLTQEERYGWITEEGAYISGKKLTHRQIYAPSTRGGPYGPELVDVAIALTPADNELTVGCMGMGPLPGYLVAELYIQGDTYVGVAGDLVDAIDQLSHAIHVGLSTGLIGGH